MGFGATKSSRNRFLEKSFGGGLEEEDEEEEGSSSRSTKGKEDQDEN